MGSKFSAPDPPDFSAVAAADAKSAELSFKLGQEQLAWAKEQSAKYDPYLMDYLRGQTETSQQARDIATEERAFYLEQYRPVEEKFVGQALNYNTPERAAQQSALAMADVSRSVDAQRQAALTSLGSYGIDPSQTKYGALDAGYRISKAAAEAAAGTQSRLNTEATQLALETEAINIGKGYPGRTAEAYNVATQAGAAGLKAADTHYATGAGAMGTPTQYFGQGNVALGNQAQALNYGGNLALQGAQLEANVGMAQSQGLGNLAGKLIGTALPFMLSDRWLKRNIISLGWIGRLMLYQFNYVWDALDEPVRQGFMADEVQRVVPEAVADVLGHSVVDYPLAIAGAMR